MKVTSILLSACCLVASSAKELEWIAIRDNEANPVARKLFLQDFLCLLLWIITFGNVKNCGKTTPFCSEFDCGDGFLLIGDAETTRGNSVEDCCIVAIGVCAGAPEGSPCSLDDIDSSLIPNPSFEEFTSCPTSFTQLFLADSWVQATGGTSDFWVGQPSCDDSVWRNGIEGIGAIPQQATDGDAFVGSIKEPARNRYEYIGACLNSPLEAMRSYTLTLNIAAAEAPSRFGGDTNGITDLLCIPSCPSFQISGFDYKGDNFDILATASPDGGLVGCGPWKSITFEVNLHRIVWPSCLDHL